MSDVQTASTAMGIPPDLVERSAAARAEADGTSIDDILAAWAGDAPPPQPSAPEEAAGTTEAEPEQPAEETEEREAEPAPSPVIEEPEVPAAPGPEVEAEPEEELEPVPLAVRVRTAVRIGAWTGAALGVFGFLVASGYWAPNTTTAENAGPVVQISPNSIIIGSALISIVFGAVVAGMSRSITGWTNPAMQLSGSKARTAWLGAAIGLVLGVIAGAMLQGFGTAVEGADPPLVQLPVLATLIIVVIGGAILGAVTALVPQLLGVPVAVDEDTEEVETVKRRLGNAVSIPLAGVLLLLLLVLPFGFTLIESNHLAPGVGGAIVAIVTAGGILGFSALAGSRPEMKISMGDLMVAIIGIGVVLVIIISVLFATSDDDPSAEPEEEAAIVQLL